MAAAAAVATEPWGHLPRLFRERKARSLRSADFCSRQCYVLTQPRRALELTNSRRAKDPHGKGSAVWLETGRNKLENLFKGAGIPLSGLQVQTAAQSGPFPEEGGAARNCIMESGLLWGALQSGDSNLLKTGRKTSALIYFLLSPASP